MDTHSGETTLFYFPSGKGSSLFPGPMGPWLQITGTLQFFPQPRKHMSLNIYRKAQKRRTLLSSYIRVRNWNLYCLTNEYQTASSQNNLEAQFVPNLRDIKIFLSLFFFFFFFY